MDFDGSGVINAKEFCDYFMLALPSDKVTFDTTVKQFLDCARECRLDKQVARDQAKSVSPKSVSPTSVSSKSVSPSTRDEAPVEAKEEQKEQEPEKEEPLLQEQEEKPDFVTLYPNSKAARLQKLMTIHQLLDVHKTGKALKEDVAALDTYDEEKNEAARQWLDSLAPTTGPAPTPS